MNSKINLIKKNLKQVFKDRKYILIQIILFLIFNIIFFLISNLKLIRGNLGKTFLFLVIFFQISISFLMALFFTISFYKFKNQRKLSKKNTLLSSFLGFLSFLFGGCISCSISLSSYIFSILGISSLLSFLPFFGIEIKVVILILLLISNFFLIKNLNKCKLKKLIKNKK